MRTMTFGRALVVAMSLVACRGAYRAYSGSERPASEVAVLRVNPNMGGGVALPAIDRVDDERVDRTPSEVDVLPGHHVVRAVVTWSNGAEEVVELAWDARAGGQYVLQQGVTGEVEPTGVEGALETLGQGAAPLAVPFVLHDAARYVAFPAGARPEGPYSVWIWDAATGATVAGSSGSVRYESPFF